MKNDTDYDNIDLFIYKRKVAGREMVADWLRKHGIEPFDYGDDFGVFPCPAITTLPNEPTIPALEARAVRLSERSLESSEVLANCESVKNR